METTRHQIRSCQKLATACLLGCMLTSCTVVGPTAIRSGRLAYNEAIISTENQQLLLLVVRHAGHVWGLDAVVTRLAWMNQRPR